MVEGGRDEREREGERDSEKEKRQVGREREIEVKLRNDLGVKTVSQIDRQTDRYL